MFYVYIIESDMHRYIGFTSNLRRRLSQHNAGQNRTTKTHKDWRLIYYEAHTNEEDAKRGEGYFKTSTGRQSLSRMLKSYYSSKSQVGSGHQRSTAGKEDKK